MKNEFEKLLLENQKIINKEIKKQLSEFKKSQLYSVELYQFSSGGKRIRSTLPLIIAKKMKKPIKSVLPLSICSEILHNWLLIHDDLQDRSLYRRGKFTIWYKYGAETAINLGDLMIHQIFDILANYYKNKLLIKLIKLTNFVVFKTMDGQTLEAKFKKKVIVSKEEYIKMVQNKTGHYLIYSLLGLCYLFNLNKNVYKNIIKYGLYVGPAFQIRDDLLNFNPKGGEEIGSDLKEGKRTLLIIHCLKESTLTERKKLRKILEKKDKIADKEIKWVINLFNKYESIEYCNKTIEIYLEKAKETIRNLPNEIKNPLNDFADYCLKRQN